MFHGHRMHDGRDGGPAYSRLRRSPSPSTSPSNPRAYAPAQLSMMKSSATVSPSAHTPSMMNSINMDIFRMGFGPSSSNQVAPAAEGVFEGLPVKRPASSNNKNTSGWCCTCCYTSCIRVPSIATINFWAAVMHFALFIAAVHARVTRPPKIYSLKYDRIYIVPRMSLPSLDTRLQGLPYDFLQMHSPWANTTRTTYNGTVAGSTASPFLSQTCGLAQPNSLGFGGSANFTLDVWTYPKESGMHVDMGACIIGFFFLSFLFQMVPTLSYWWCSGAKDSSCCCGCISCGGRALCGSCCGQPMCPSYASIFEDGNYMADSNLDAEHAEGIINAAHKFDVGTANVLNHAKEEMQFNWLRFAEYTFSGSLVLFVICLLLGIYDVELLTCIYVMAATCMLLGALAEVFLRFNNTLRAVLVIVQECVREYQTLNPSSPLNGTMNKCTEILSSFVTAFKACFWVSHVLGWVCILVPWLIILLRFNDWNNPCMAETLAVSTNLTNIATGGAIGIDENAAMSRRKPPDFVYVSFWNLCVYFCEVADTWMIFVIQVIVIMELMLYTSFGMVQLLMPFDWCLRGRNRISEIVYIVLSLVAKGLLGILLFSSVLFA